MTRNSRDFAPLLRQWAEAGRSHAGCILVWTLAHHEFGAIIEGIEGQLALRVDPEEWRDLAVAF